jgi:hypothetical protein
MIAAFSRLSLFRLRVLLIGQKVSAAVRSTFPYIVLCNVRGVLHMYMEYSIHSSSNSIFHELGMLNTIPDTTIVTFLQIPGIYAESVNTVLST